MRRLASCFLLALALPGAAHADGKLAPVHNEAWKAECGSCHLAYPPQLLSAESWRRLMSGLGRHFGTDASVDPGTAREIGAFLARHAASRPGRHAAQGDSPRISQTPWFTHEHDEVPQGAWRRASVRSAANCGACHRDAERGDFRERGIRIPQ